MKETIGACKFCHQTKMVMVPDDATTELIEQEATINCTCKLSQEYADKARREESVKMSIEAAKASVENLFEGEHFEELREALKGSVEAIARKKIKKGHYQCDIEDKGNNPNERRCNTCNTNRNRKVRTGDLNRIIYHNITVLPGTRAGRKGAMWDRTTKNIWERTEYQ